MDQRSAPLDVTQLVGEHYQTLYRYAYRLTGSPADAEDLVQQVFLIAHQKIDQVRDAACARGWLFAVLRNAWLKTRRQRMPVMTEIDVDTLPEAPRQAIDGQDLQAALDGLADEFRLVVLMFYFEHQSYREIAQHLDLPIGTVMSRLARAKAHLRRRLADVEANLRTDREQSAPPRHEPTTIRP